MTDEARSRLFHAVVGVGIALGAPAGCGGSVTGEPGAAAAGGAAGSAGAPTLDAGVEPDASTADGSTSDGGLVADATIADVAAEVGKDAIVEAFCDVSWPITKSGREVCGPYDGCATIEAPWCFGKAPDGSCKLYPLICVGQEWQCTGSSTPTQSPSPPPECQ